MIGVWVAVAAVVVAAVAVGWWRWSLRTTRHERWVAELIRDDADLQELNDAWRLGHNERRHHRA